MREIEKYSKIGNAKALSLIGLMLASIVILALNSAVQTAIALISVREPTDGIVPSIKTLSPLGGAAVPVGTRMVTGMASDVGSGVASVQISLDRGSYITAVPKVAGDWSTWSGSLNIATAGSHTIYAKATDKAGNYMTTPISITATVENKKMLFATVLPYVSLPTQNELYSPHMLATDYSKLHVGLNKGFTVTQLDMVKSMKGLHGAEFFSLAEIKANAAILKARGFDYISYDLEPGLTYSPQSEINDPIGSIKAASLVAHSNGLKLQIAPSRAITTLYGPQLAPYVDMYHIQSQALQGTPDQFKSYVVDTAGKLRTANPHLSITVQVSTSREAAAGMTLLNTMEQDWSLVRGNVDGITVWFSNNEPSISTLRNFVAWFDSTR